MPFQQMTFVPREEEFQRLEELLDQAVREEGQVCFVAGEAGSGKSTLVQAFTRRAQQHDSDLLVAFGDCNAQTGAGDPYLPFREILAQLAGDVEDSVAEGVITPENADRLRRFYRVSKDIIIDLGIDMVGALLPGGSLLLRLGSQLLGAKAGARQAETARPALDQSKILEQYTNVVRALAQHQPLVLLVDDLHWADSASIDLLFHLARRIEGSRVLIVGTYRPQDIAIGRRGGRHPLVPALAELKRYYGDVLIDLDATAEEQQRRFVNALVDTRPNRLGKEFRSALVRHTEGNPLFTVELLSNFEAEGIIGRDADGWLNLVGALAWDTLPSKIEGVIEERIGRLDEAATRRLTVASVLGEEFLGEVVARVLREPERDVIRCLSGELEKQHHIVRAHGTQAIGAHRISRYRFRHNLFQKYLYGGLDAVERAYLHEDVGHVLEELYGPSRGTIAVELAHHFVEAGRHERALGYLEQAGDNAAALFAQVEARLHYHEALSALEQLPETREHERTRVRLAAKLMGVAHLGESPEENIALLNEVEPLAARLAEGPGADRDDRLGLARIYYWMGRIHFLRNAPREAIGTYAKTLAIAKEVGDAELAAVPASVIGRTLVSQGNFGKAEPLLRGALEPLERSGNVTEATSTLGFLGIAVSGQGRYREGLEYSERAVTLAADRGDHMTAAACMQYVWACHMFGGDWGEMLAATKRGVAAAQSAAATVPLYVGLVGQTWAECRNGLLTAAEETAARCRKAAMALGPNLVIADWLAAAEAEIELRKEAWEVAAERARATVERARASGGVYAEAVAQRIWGVALTHLGEEHWPEALEHLRASLAAASAGNIQPEVGRTHAAWARLCEARREHGAAAEHLELCRRSVAEVDTPVDLADMVGGG